ncbi:MAG: hypothetical protein K8R59_11625 [Thermoanaerobaculales bacterium]|nr:hypothetical protein [Thermoanaerobaculales bacterium]
MPGVLSLTLRERLQRRGPGRIRPSLDGLTVALNQLGKPQELFRSVLVVGTNGKGSTAVILERILAASGLKTGLYTSPHLVRVNERIRSSGAPVSDDTLAEILGRLDGFPDLTFFETLTAAAFLCFAESGVDVVVLEAGMGGRWDATRLAGSRVAGLTNIGSDHRKWLGETPSEVASDKGAALAAASSAILGPGVNPAVVADLLAPEARFAAEIIELESGDHSRSMRARWDGSDWCGLSLPLEGRHQRDNLHLALALALVELQEGWEGELNGEDVRRGLAEVHWPGRFSSTEVEGRTVLLDGAHNLEAAEALATHLRDLPGTYNLLFSCLEDKPVAAMARVLGPVVGEVAVFPLDDERAMPLERLSEAFPSSLCAQSPWEALALLRDPVVAAGSLRVVGMLLEEGAAGPDLGRS